MYGILVIKGRINAYTQVCLTLKYRLLPKGVIRLGNNLLTYLTGHFVPKVN